MLASRSLLTFSRLDEQADLTQFLIQAGFLTQESGGVFNYTSLGILALDTIERRLHDALTDEGATRVQLSLLQSNENWQRTGRASDYGEELMSVKLRSGSLMRLSATAEEQITALAGRYLAGRHVNHWFYQIGTKWRDEIRARAGLLRSREFRMMDAYHFSKTKEDMLTQHETARDRLVAYLESFGCQVRVIDADCGEIGGLMSQEIQVATSLEEDGWLEVGHCFALGQAYSQAFDFKGADGEAVWMGCQGIGTSRLLAVLLAARRDGRKLWGDEHFAVVDSVVVGIGKQEDTQARAMQLYNALRASGKTVVMEDRFTRAGQALNASESLGAQYRWVVSDRLGEGVAEKTTLSTGETEVVSL